MVNVSSIFLPSIALWTVTILFVLVTMEKQNVVAAFMTTTTTKPSLFPTNNVFRSCRFNNNVMENSSRRTQLFLAAAPRQPRRMLKKRRRRRERDAQLLEEDDFPWDTAESRPLISSRSREAGEDYWIAEEDMEAELAREQAIANRIAMEGEVPKEKLWTEVKAPYRQNWIGYFSLMILLISAVVIKFPELLEQPIIAIPDL